MVNFKPVVLFLKTIQGKRGANFFSYNFQNFNSDFHFPKKIFCILIFSNILWSKEKQTLEFGHLIEYNNRNIFLQKSCNK